MKRALHLFKYPMYTLRRPLIQPVFWAFCFLGPVLNIFRVDMIQQRVIFWGEAYPFRFETLMWLPIGFYGGVIVIGVLSFIGGRLFCGWACPHNTLTEWTRPFRALVNLEEKSPSLKRLARWHPHLSELLTVASPLLALSLTTILSFLLSFYVVSPRWVGEQYVSGSPHIALVWGHGLFILIGLFLLYAGHHFCRTCCPYGLAQSVSAYHENSRWRPMEIAFQAESLTECGSCTGCIQVCPVTIDPRQPDNLKVGQFDGCFNCGECIDACQYLHDYKAQAGFLAFQAPGLQKS